MTDQLPRPNPAFDRPPIEGLIAPDQRAEAMRLELLQTLPKFAAELVMSERYQDASDPYRKTFAQDPNQAAMHSPWHQWGIVRHTVMMSRYIDDKVPELLKSYYNLDRESVDGITKWDLIRIAVPAHDYGKFTQRQYIGEIEGRPEFNFANHEVESGNIVRACHDRFSRMGLSDPQIEYVARCTELHYELGKLRDAAKRSDIGYTFALMESKIFIDMVRNVHDIAPEMSREMGVLYVADSLAKTDIHDTLVANSDDELQQLQPQIERQLAERQLPLSLLPAAMQLGINVTAGKEYLRLMSLQ